MDFKSTRILKLKLFGSLGNFVSFCKRCNQNSWAKRSNRKEIWALRGSCENTCICFTSLCTVNMLSQFLITRLYIKVNLLSIRFLSVFLRFCFFLKKYALFHPHFLKSISALTRRSHTGQKFSEKSFLWRSTALFWNIALVVHTQNFYLYTTVYLVRIWTYKNADEKAHTFSRSKNVKKRTKTNEKRILCKFTFSLVLKSAAETKRQAFAGLCPVENLEVLV